MAFRNPLNLLPVRKPNIKFQFILAALLWSIWPAASADFEKGLAAYDRGDYAAALREWETAYPNMNDADAAAAAFSLGWMYQKGEGVARDDNMAMDWYLLAVERGSNDARHILNITAEQGNAAAQYTLGEMHERGRGVAKDSEMAVQWYTRAARQGHVDARKKLGHGYGTLTLELEPADARIILPDIEPRYRPGLELPAGEYRVVVRRAGYEEFEGTVRIEAGQRTTRAIALRRAVPERAVGEVFRDSLKSGGEGPEMVVLPTGRFRMGDLSGEGSNDEKPVRRVTLSRPIAMGKYEVTFTEYDRFARATGRDRPDDEGWGRGNRPVIDVSQEDAQAYARWLSEQTGRDYRLPSEAEWKYAARAGTTTKYSWGDEIGRNQANCNGCGSEWDYKKTAPVGSFAANAFGLYDMHGNVWEWVKDCWHDNYEGAPSDGRAWTTGCDGYSRAVLCGGSWDNNPLVLRSANRYKDGPSARIDNYGFRLVQDITP